MKIIFVNALTTPPTAHSVDTTDSFGIGERELDVARGRTPHSARTVWSQGERWRVVAVNAGNGQALVLAQSLQATDRMLDRLGLVMLLFGIAGMIAAGLAGWAVARNGLRPVRRLTTAVEDIARTQQLDPIPVEGSDEVARLAQSFNEMLHALSASQRRQRQLVADAGHELRTPLTSLRTNLDLLVQADASHGLSAQSRAELLEDVRAQINEMTTLIGDLVELARDDPVSPTVEPVELTAVLGQAVARVRRRADVEFEVSTSPWWVTGEADALERAITNLLDNAAKWSPPGRRGEDHARAMARLMVADEGPGISPQGPAARLRPVLPVRGVPGDARIGTGSVDRPLGGRAPRWPGPRRGRPTWRCRVLVEPRPGEPAPPEVLARS